MHVSSTLVTSKEAMCFYFNIFFKKKDMGCNWDVIV